MNTIESLQALYVKLGGSLTDTYEDIAGGVPVSDYAIIPDMIAAVAKKLSGGGGGGGVLVVSALRGNGSEYVSQAKFGDVYNAISNMQPVMFKFEFQDPGFSWLHTFHDGVLWYTNVDSDTGEIFLSVNTNRGPENPNNYWGVLAASGQPDDTITFNPYQP